jgi:acyl-CoA hydrolase
MTYLEPSTVIRRRSGEARIDEWAAPDACDRQGFVRAGTVLEWLNAAGALAASRFARQPVATIAVDGMRVRRRIATGDRVALTARVVHTSTRSIGVAVAMSAGHGGPVLDALVTFVVVGADGHAAPVPRFFPTSIEELAGFHEAEARARFRHDLAWSHGGGAGASPHVPTSETGSVFLLRDLGARFATIERCAATSAAGFLSTPPRLLAVDGLAFLRRLAPDVVVRLRATAVHSDDLGVTVLVRAHAEDPRSLAVAAPAMRGFFTYAPVDPTCAIPRLARVGRDDSVFCEVALRHRLREAITDLRSA